MKLIAEPNGLRAYHGKESIKQKYLDRVKAHRAADELHQGATGANGKGCAVYCTLDKYDHGAYEEELGIPQVLARFEDRIFEGLPVQESQEWPERFLSAITPGAKLDKVWISFMRWLLDETLSHNRKLPAPLTDVIKSVVKIRDLYVRLEAGEVIPAQTWFDASSDADANADYAAAVASYSANAARSARYAANYAARSADAAWFSSAYAGYATDYAAHAARTADYAANAADFWVKSANKLEEQLKAAV